MKGAYLRYVAACIAPESGTLGSCKPTNQDRKQLLGNEAAAIASIADLAQNARLGEALDVLLRLRFIGCDSSMATDRAGQSPTFGHRYCPAISTTPLHSLPPFK